MIHQVMRGSLVVLFLLLGCDTQQTNTKSVDSLCSEPDIGCFDPTWSKESTSYGLQFVSASPQLPERGSNDWQIHMTSNNMASLDNCNISVTPFMPEHGHGVPAQPNVMKTTQNHYLIQDILFTMPGLWEMTF